MKYANVCFWDVKNEKEKEDGRVIIELSAKESAIICDALKEYSSNNKRKKNVRDLWEQWTMSMPWMA